MPEPIFMKLSMYTMVPKPVSTTYYINPLTSVSVCMYIPFIFTRQLLSKDVPAATNTRNRRTAGRVVAKESKPLVIP
jgi:hypothetical protein